MKKTFLILLIINILIDLSFAKSDSSNTFKTRFQDKLLKPQKEKCDICGCGAGNYYLGMMPQFHRNFVGIRYRSKTYDSHIGLSEALATRETYHTAELWARIYAHPKVQILTFVPYQFNQQQTTVDSKNLTGLGDMVILANYNLINQTLDTISRTFKHILWLGGGIKLPTGKSKFVDDGTEVANANFQLGTGSLDFMLNFIYTIRAGKFGLNTDFTYKINTQNRNKYHFGNRINSTISAFYIQKLGDFGLMPNLGIYWEQSQKDQRNQSLVDETGGSATFANLGLETYFKSFSLGFNFQNPLQQNLANGQIQAHQRALVHLTCLF